MIKINLNDLNRKLNNIETLLLELRELDLIGKVGEGCEMENQLPHSPIDNKSITELKVYVKYSKHIHISEKPKACNCYSNPQTSYYRNNPFIFIICNFLIRIIIQLLCYW